MRKKQNNYANLKFLEIFSRFKINIFAYFVLRFPGEDPIELKKTLNGLEKMGSGYRYIQLSEFVLKKNSPIFKKARQFGINKIKLLKNYHEGYSSKTASALSTFDFHCKNRASDQEAYSLIRESVSKIIPRRTADSLECKIKNPFFDRYRII